MRFLFPPADVARHQQYATVRAFRRIHGVRDVPLPLTVVAQSSLQRLHRQSFLCRQGSLPSNDVRIVAKGRRRVCQAN